MQRYQLKVTIIINFLNVELGDNAGEENPSERTNLARDLEVLIVIIENVIIIDSHHNKLHTYMYSFRCFLQKIKILQISRALVHE